MRESLPTVKPRVALVHDFLLDLRGAERVFCEICDMWPEADLFTAVYDETGTEGRFADRRVHTSALQHFRPSAQNFRLLFPFYQGAIESLDLAGYDLVISSSSAWAHGVLCDENAVHLSYCHNPFRYAWNDRDRTLQRYDPVRRWLLGVAFRRWRRWDLTAAQRTDRYVAVSQLTRARIREYYHRESDIVHPPVDTSRFSPGPVSDYYVIVSELMVHKQIVTAVEAFNKLRLPLMIVGDGPDARQLQRLAGPTITLTGRLSDRGVEQAMQGARAMIVTSVEEFGIAAVESQAAGRPVIARRGGGVLETIVDGVTGTWWSGGPLDLARTVQAFDDAAIDPQACVANARRFDRERFREELRAQVRDAIETRGRPVPAPRRQPLVAGRLMRRVVREPAAR